MLRVARACLDASVSNRRITDRYVREQVVTTHSLFVDDFRNAHAVHHLHQRVVAGIVALAEGRTTAEVLEEMLAAMGATPSRREAEVGANGANA